MAGILRNFQPALKNVFLEIKKTCIRDNLKRSPDTFPSQEDASKVAWIPDTLRHLLMKQVIKSEVKVESIGHCVVKGVLPRSFTPPILFALVVELDHMFGSRWLNTQLFKLGFSQSYGGVIRFNQTVVIIEEIGAILQSSAAEDNFTTFVADNVDHNIIGISGI